MTRRALTWTANAAASGVIGWVALIGVFEAAYWGEAWLTQWRRKRGA